MLCVLHYRPLQPINDRLLTYFPTSVLQNVDHATGSDNMYLGPIDKTQVGAIQPGMEIGPVMQSPEKSARTLVNSPVSIPSVLDHHLLDISLVETPTELLSVPIITEAPLVVAPPPVVDSPGLDTRMADEVIYLLVMQED